MTNDELAVIVDDIMDLLEAAIDYGYAKQQQKCIAQLQAIQRLLNDTWPPEADSDFTAELPF